MWQTNCNNGCATTCGNTFGNDYIWIILIVVALLVCFGGFGTGCNNGCGNTCI